MSTNLDKKFEFLKTVKMPSRDTILACIKEYAEYKGGHGDAGKYGYFVRYKLADMDVDYNEEDEILLTSQKKLLQEEIKELNASTEKAKRINVSTGDFIHIKIGMQRTTEGRLYLRILPCNVHKLARALTKECFAKNLPTHFKFAMGRNDSFVIYTDYDLCQEFVDVIKKIRQEQPKLFKNAEKLHPLWGNIDGFIGFMEEPKIEAKNGEIKLDKSASTYRTKFLEDITTHKSFKGLEFLTTSYLRQFSLPLDIDPNFLPLNASTVQQLNEAGYNTSLIGSGKTNVSSSNL